MILSRSSGCRGSRGLQCSDTRVALLMWWIGSCSRLAGGRGDGAPPSSPPLPGPGASSGDGVCASAPCLNGAACFVLVGAAEASRAHDEQQPSATAAATPASPASATTFGCHCRPGWAMGICARGYPAEYEAECNVTGERCDMDMDECISAPCLNGGVCVDSASTAGSVPPDDFRCDCAAGWSGTHCERTPAAPAAARGMAGDADRRHRRPVVQEEEGERCDLVALIRAAHGASCGTEGLQLAAEGEVVSFRSPASGMWQVRARPVRPFRRPRPNAFLPETGQKRPPLCMRMRRGGHSPAGATSLINRCVCDLSCGSRAPCLPSDGASHAFSSASIHCATSIPAIRL
jgi:hypothetical protein